MSERTKAKLERIWQHRGMFCLAVGNTLGHRCGYVRIPDDHPDFARFDNKRLQEMEEWSKSTEPVFTMYKTPEQRLALARQDYWEMHVEVHGGITFAEQISDHGWENILEGGDGVPDGYWIGFDCAHLYDARDHELLRSFGEEHYAQIMKFTGPHWDEGHTWSLEEVVQETNSMADQVVKLYSIGKEVILSPEEDPRSSS